MTETKKDYRKIALQKCYDIEKEPASEAQTMAVMVASVALDIVEKFPYPDGPIQTLHRAADCILAAHKEIQERDEAFGVVEDQNYALIDRIGELTFTPEEAQALLNHTSGHIPTGWAPSVSEKLRRIASGASQKGDRAK